MGTRTNYWRCAAGAAALLSLTACGQATTFSGKLARSGRGVKTDTTAPAHAENAVPRSAPLPAPAPAPAAKPTPDVVDKLKRLPKFGLLVNDLECGLCHVSVVGDIVSTRDVPPLWQSSDVALTGSWTAAHAFDAAVPCKDPAAPLCPGKAVIVAASNGVKANTVSATMPLGADGLPGFPALDFAALPPLMTGTVRTLGAFATSAAKVVPGNLVLTGTKAEPIELAGDLYVGGDLVIKGYYAGTGSIYVAGNIYIPADLRAVHSAFPFPDDPVAALAAAEAQLAQGTPDALGLASANSVFIADLEKQQNSDPGNEAVTVYTHPSTPVNRTAAALGTYAVFNWFPGGQPAYTALYDAAVSCLSQQPTQTGSFNVVEAFLYAKNTVAGISRRASYSIRGGVIADYYHVISGASHCDQTLSPVHGRPGNRSYIEYDYRLKTGKLRILEHVGALFPQAAAP